MNNHRILQCADPACSFRFPVAPGEEEPRRCPNCGKGDLHIELIYDPSKVNPSSFPNRSPILEVLLDNIRSGFNVGAMFRSADGAGVQRLHLCGVTPTPTHPRVAKTALGAEEAVPWTYHTNSLHAAAELIERGFKIWALEGGETAVSIFTSLPEAAREGLHLGLVVGNEVNGVDPAVLDLCEKRIAIPMQGVKDSLNVAIAFGIAIYLLRNASSLLINNVLTNTRKTT